MQGRTVRAAVELGLEPTDNSLFLLPHHTVSGAALAFAPSLGQETDGPKAGGVKAGVAKGQSSAMYQQHGQVKSPDLTRAQVPQGDLRIKIVHISLSGVQIIK